MMSHITLLVAGYAFLGGVLPALIWLYFLLKEDSRCPEPKPLIVLAFVAGMIAVPLAIPLENLASEHFKALGFAATSLPILFAWAMAEETLKYIAAAIFILWRHAVDEAPDYVIYMLTVALGFAALENALFLIAPLSGGHFVAGFELDNLRFVGSTLLHVLASSAIGFGFAFSYKKSRPVRIVAASLGLILAVALHTLFNQLIISGDGKETLAGFFLIWCGAVVFFALFEILKYVRYRNLPKNTC